MMGFRFAACLVFLSVGFAVPRANAFTQVPQGPPAPPSEPIDRRLYFKLPLEQVRFHWRFLERDAFLAGSLTLRIIRDGAVDSIVVFQNGAVAEGWAPIPQTGTTGEIYFGFESSMRYATAPGDSLEIELVALEPLTGIGAYQQGTLPAGRYLSTGSFSSLTDDDSAQWIRMIAMMKGIPRDELESMPEIQALRERLSAIEGRMEYMAFMECWRQPWSLTITAEEGWLPAARAAESRAWTSRLAGAPDEMGTDGRSCAAQPSPPSDTLVLDVQRADRLASWTVTQAPQLVIPGLEEESQWGDWRIAEAARMESGDIVVAYFGTDRLYFHDPFGQIVDSTESFGISRGAPLVTRGLLLLRGDTILTWDNNSQMHLFDERRAVVDSRSFVSGGVPFPFGQLENGSFVAVIHEWDTPSAGLSRAPASFSKVSWPSLGRENLGSLPTTERFFAACVEGGDPPITCDIALPFGRVLHSVSDGTVAYLGNGDRPELLVFGNNGIEKRLTWSNVAARPVTPEMVEWWREYLVRQRPHWESLDLPIPDHVPFYTDLLIDDDGLLWIKVSIDEYEPPRWEVLDPDGRFLATVDMPREVVVTQIGRDYVLGIKLERRIPVAVVLYGLTR